jgi:hypothetical protein
MELSWAGMKPAYGSTQKMDRKDNDGDGGVAEGQEG